MSWEQSKSVLKPPVSLFSFRNVRLLRVPISALKLAGWFRLSIKTCVRAREAPKHELLKPTVLLRAP